MLAGTASFASTTENLEAKETRSEMTAVFSETTSVTKSSIVNNDDKWYTKTVITTHNYFILGVWVGSSVDTVTTIIWQD